MFGFKLSVRDVSKSAREDGMTQEEDTALIAAQLADLTATVEAMAKELQALSERTNCPAHTGCERLRR